MDIEEKVDLLEKKVDLILVELKNIRTKIEARINNVEYNKKSENVNHQ